MILVLLCSLGPQFRISALFFSKRWGLLQWFCFECDDHFLFNSLILAVSLSISSSHSLFIAFLVAGIGILGSILMSSKNHSNSWPILSRSILRLCSYFVSSSNISVSIFRIICVSFCCSSCCSCCRIVIITSKFRLFN